MIVKVSSMCSGHGRCYVLASEVYEADDVGYNKHRDGEFEVSDELEALVRRGAAACPERAISVEPS
jgi:ferredoxin